MAMVNQKQAERLHYKGCKIQPFDVLVCVTKSYIEVLAKYY